MVGDEQVGTLGNCLCSLEPAMQSGHAPPLPVLTLVHFSQSSLFKPQAFCSGGSLNLGFS